MGAGPSKVGQNDTAVSRNNGPLDDEDSDDEGFCECNLPILSSFVRPRARSSSNSNDKKHTTTKKEKKGKYDPIGTPMPDTPDAARRQRTRDFYGGLEQESSERGMDVNSDWVRRPSAQVYEGKKVDLQFKKKYELLQVLGVGSTATCHLCINRLDGQKYACKIIDKKQIELRFQGMIDQFHTEIQALRSLHHPNIITLYDVFITENKIYIVTELMEGGELFDYVVQKGTLTEEEASRIVRMVTCALVYMHSKNIIHRDLKPENLLLTHKPRSSYDVEVKIIDFGLSKCMNESVACSFLGTRGYLAPEMLQRRSYSREVDAWALGVIVFVLLCGCLPFDDDSNTVPSDEMVRSKFSLRFPRWAKGLSPSAKDLLSHLLDVNPQTRFTAEQALEHTWVKGETAPKESLLTSPRRIKLTPGGNPRRGAAAPVATKDHVNVNQMVTNRARHNSGHVSGHNNNNSGHNNSGQKITRQLVRKTSI